MRTEVGTDFERIFPYLKMECENWWFKLVARFSSVRICMNVIWMKFNYDSEKNYNTVLYKWHITWLWSLRLYK